MTYGIGGIHAVVMPFYDFRIVGVFVVICAWSFIFARIEQKPLSFNRISLLGMVFAAAPWWLWYGEKSIINAIIIWWLLMKLHKLFACRCSTVRTGLHDRYVSSKVSITQ
jgi:hypothetical protein